MVETKAFATPTAMEGHGAYNRSSRVQAAGLSPAVPLLEKAAKQVMLPPLSQPILIADYGSSEGHNSLAPMGAAIAVLRDRTGPERTIWIVHADVPENDFTVLFRTLNTDPNSYLCRDRATYGMAVGRSFYEQIFPANSVTLGWSSWAVQWLSRAPGAIPDHVQVAFSHDAAARDAFSRRAAEDWRSFLIARGQELCPGGQLVMLTMGIDAEGEFGYQPLCAAIYAELLSLVSEGFLREEEMRRMTIPTVGRSREDLLAPFEAEGHFAKLRVEELDVFPGEDHIWLQFERNGDGRAFGAAWAAFSRASVFPTLAKSLDGGNDEARASQFMNRLESGTAARLAAAPERMRIPLAKMLLVKGE